MRFAATTIFRFYNFVFFAPLFGELNPEAVTVLLTTTLFVLSVVLSHVEIDVFEILRA